MSTPSDFEKGYIKRQLKHADRAVAKWPAWMRRESGPQRPLAADVYIIVSKAYGPLYECAEGRLVVSKLRISSFAARKDAKASISRHVAFWRGKHPAVANLPFSCGADFSIRVVRGGSA